MDNESKFRLDGIYWFFSKQPDKPLRPFILSNHNNDINFFDTDKGRIHIKPEEYSSIPPMPAHKAAAYILYNRGEIDYQSKTSIDMLMDYGTSFTARFSNPTLFKLGRFLAKHKGSNKELRSLINQFCSETALTQDEVMSLANALHKQHLKKLDAESSKREDHSRER